MSANPKPTNIDIDSSLHAFEPKTFKVDDVFHYFVVNNKPPAKRESKNPDAVLMKSEQKIIEQAAAHMALRQLNTEPFARIGSNNRTRTRRFLIKDGDISKESLDLLSGTEYSAVVTIWEGLGRYLETIDDAQSSTEQRSVPEPEIGALVPSANGLAHANGLGVQPVEAPKAQPGETPKPLDQHRWERTYLPKDHQSQLRYRFAKVELFKYDRDWMNSELLAQRFAQIVDAKVNPTQLHLFAVKVSFDRVQASMKDVARQVREAENSITKNHMTEWIQALLKKEFDTETNQVVHGKKFYPLNDGSAKDVQGLKFCVGSNRDLRISFQEEPILVEGICTKLFLPDSSVAKFIKIHCSQSNITDFDHYLGQLNRLLRGRLVTIKTNQVTEERAIYMVSRDTPEKSDPSSRHHVWSNGADRKLQYPTLPCLDVGTPGRHVLIPPEFCSFKPMQRFKGPYTVGLESQLTQFRKKREHESKAASAATYDAPSSNIKLEETLYVTRLQRSTIKDKDKQLQLQNVFQTSSPAITFADAGVNKVTSLPWRYLRMCLTQKGSDFRKASTDGKAIGASSLHMRYSPGSDHFILWKSQIVAALKAYKFEDKDPMLVVVIEKGQYEKDIYKTIKHICDIELGVQSFFVNLENIHKKTRACGAEKDEGPSKAANEVISRVRTRNVPLLVDNPTGIKDIEVAIHTGRVAATGPVVGKQGQVTKEPIVRFIVIFVMREKGNSDRYLTKVFLKNAETVHTFSIANALKMELPKLVPKDEPQSKSHRITILRSGILPNDDGKVYAGQKNDKVRGMCGSGQMIDMFNHHFPFENVDAFHEDVAQNEAIQRTMAEESRNRKIDERKSVTSRAELANKEFINIRESIKSDFTNKTRVSYILLAEDREFGLPKSAKSAIQRAIKLQIGGKPSASSLFLAGTKLQLGKYDVSAHRSVTASSNSKLINMTLMGDPLASDAKAPPPNPRAPGIKADDRQEGHTKGVKRDLESELETSSDSQEEQDEPEDNKEETVSQVSSGELSRLAELWVDERIELYDTKWPVATHLAHLAMKRARLHLRWDEWNKKDDNAPCHLPDVHAKVEHTLYFL